MCSGSEYPKGRYKCARVLVNLNHFLFSLACITTTLPQLSRSFATMSKITNHVYEGSDVDFHGSQILELPGPAFDDVFKHIHVEDYVNGYLIIRRIEKGMLMLPQKRTCGHVRTLKSSDGPVPDVIGEEEMCPKSNNKEEMCPNSNNDTPPKTKTAAVSPKNLTPAASPENLTSEVHQADVTPQNHTDGAATPTTPTDEHQYVSYSDYVANLELAGKRRLPLHGMDPRVTGWGVIVESPGLRAFEGYDNQPPRQGLQVSKKGKKTQHEHTESPGGLVVKIAAPGTVWTLPVSGGVMRFCCLHGFQVRSGPFYTLLTQTSYVESMIAKDMPANVDFSRYVKIKVDDLFAHGLPESRMNKAVRTAGEEIASHFVDKVRIFKQWASVKTIMSAVRPYTLTQKNNPFPNNHKCKP